jgi:hypothetical protein
VSFRFLEQGLSSQIENVKANVALSRVTACQGCRKPYFQDTPVSKPGHEPGKMNVQMREDPPFTQAIQIRLVHDLSTVAWSIMISFTTAHIKRP